MLGVFRSLMSIFCYQSPITGRHIVQGFERCRIERAKFIRCDGTGTIIEKDICRRCGETEELKAPEIPFKTDRKVSGLV